MNKAPLHKLPGPRVLSAARCFGWTLIAALLAGCPASKETNSKVTEGKIAIKGSNTLGEELIPHLVAEYKKDRPQVTFDLESKGTASGFIALMEGGCDIAGASRVATNDELTQAHKRGLDLDMHVVGSYSFALIAHPANSVTNLSREQVRDIFTGAIQNWKEVGGADALILIYGRDPISGTYLGFRELAMNDKPYAAGLKTCTNYAGIAEAVARETNAIGYVSLNLVNYAGVKPVAVRGVLPTAFNVNEGQYPFSRVLRLYANRSKVTPAMRDFIEFAQATRGQAIVEQLGFVPRP